MCSYPTGACRSGALAAIYALRCPPADAVSTFRRCFPLAPKAPRKDFRLAMDHAAHLNADGADGHVDLVRVIEARVAEVDQGDGEQHQRD